MTRNSAIMHLQKTLSYEQVFRRKQRTRIAKYAIRLLEDKLTAIQRTNLEPSHSPQIYRIEPFANGRHY